MTAIDVLRCRVGIHRWVYDGPWVGGVAYRRRCLRCGVEQLLCRDPFSPVGAPVWTPNKPVARQEDRP